MALRMPTLLLATQVLSAIAAWLDIFLLFTVPVFVWQCTPAQVAAVASLYGLPSLVIGPVFGALLDRCDPMTATRCGAVARVVATIAIAFAPSFPIFAALVLVKGLANLVFGASSTVLTNTIVEPGRRVRYFADLSALTQLCKIGAPLAAGWLCLQWPAPRVFLVSAAATAIAAVLFAALAASAADVRKARQAARRPLSMWHDLLDGVRGLRALPPVLQRSIALQLGIACALALYDPQLAATLRSLGMAPQAFAVVVTATGCGAIVAASCVRLFWRRATADTLMARGTFAFALAIAVAAALMSLSRMTLPALVGLWLMNGFGYELLMIGASVNLQDHTPPHALGRIATAVRSLGMSAAVTLPSVGAWLVQSGGLAAPFIGAAALAAGVAAWSTHAKAVSAPA